MVLSTANTADGCVLTTDVNQQVSGIWQNNSTRAENGKLVIGGVTKAYISGGTAIAPMTRLAASTTAGHLQTHSLDNGNIACALALEALSTSSTGVITVFMAPNVGSSST
jgi:hypothetical protein